MRLRTIEQASEYVRAADPETALTKTAIRRFVTTGVIPSVRSGQKYLVALENLDAYLSGKSSDEPSEERAGEIRRVEI